MTYDPWPKPLSWREPPPSTRMLRQAAESVDTEFIFRALSAEGRRNFALHVDGDPRKPFHVTGARCIAVLRAELASRCRVGGTAA